MKNMPKWMTTITPVSTIIAAVLFVSLPFAGYFLGIASVPQAEAPVTSKTVMTITTRVMTATVTPTVTRTATIDPYLGWKDYKSDEFGVTIKLPSSFYSYGKQYIIDGANKNADVIASDSTISCSKGGASWLRSSCDDTKSLTYTYKELIVKSKVNATDSVILFQLPPYEYYTCNDLDSSGNMPKTTKKSEADLTILGKIFKVTDTFYTNTNKTCDISVARSGSTTDASISPYPDAASSSKWKVFYINGILDISDKALEADNHGLSDLARKIFESIKYS